MAAVRNVHVNRLNDVIKGEFSMLNVSEVITASDSVLREMYSELNLDNDCIIRQSHLNKRTLPKEKLAEWLETVCYILDSFSVPLLKNAVSSVDCSTKRIVELQREKIDDQNEII